MTYDLYAEPIEQHARRQLREEIVHENAERSRPASVACMPNFAASAAAADRAGRHGQADAHIWLVTFATLLEADWPKIDVVSACTRILVLGGAALLKEALSLDAARDFEFRVLPRTYG